MFQQQDISPLKTPPVTTTVSSKSPLVKSDRNTHRHTQTRVRFPPFTTVNKAELQPTTKFLNSKIQKASLDQRLLQALVLLLELLHLHAVALENAHVYKLNKLNRKNPNGFVQVRRQDLLLS